MAATETAKDLSGAPYKIVPKGGKFQVVNNLGVVKATFDDEAAARKYQKALYANVPGAAKVAENKPWTGDAKRRTAAMVELEMAADAYIEQAKDFSQDKRDKLAKTGAAMSDGSYPIESGGDLRNALMAFGRSKNPDATKAHIRKRAAALGLSGNLPDSWK